MFGLRADEVQCGSLWKRMASFIAGVQTFSLETVMSSLERESLRRRFNLSSACKRNGDIYIPGPSVIELCKSRGGMMKGNSMRTLTMEGIHPGCTGETNLISLREMIMP